MSVTSAAQVANPDRRDAAVKTFQREVQLRTAGGLTVTDITDEVREAVRESGGVSRTASALHLLTAHGEVLGARERVGARGFLEDFAVMLKRLVGRPSTSSVISVTVSPPAVRNCTSRWNVFTAASLRSGFAT